MDNTYETPIVEVMEIQIEAGFAATQTGGTPEMPFGPGF